MKNSRLIRLLKTLTAKELKAFTRYVASPFFNRNERLGILMEALLAQEPEFDLSKKAAFRLMFGKKAPYEEQKVYDHASALFRLLEGFLSYQLYQADMWWEKRLLLHSMMERGQGDHFRRQYRQLVESLETESASHAELFLQRFWVSLEADRFFGRQHVRDLDQRDSLPDMVENLDLFYFASKLIYSCEMLNRNNIVNTTYDPPLMKEVASMLEQSTLPYKDVPLIAIYLCIYHSLTDSENEIHYEQLVELLQKESSRFAAHEARDMYGYALNYCTKQLNRGNQGYLGRIFQLYQQLLDKELLLEEGQLAHWHFKNIATVGIRLQEYDWVFQFLDQYREKIHPEQRENTYNYNLSVWYYEQKKYHQALQQLQKVSFSDVYYDLSARSLVLKIYCETSEFDSLDYHLKAFQSYLRRY